MNPSGFHFLLDAFASALSRFDEWQSQFDPMTAFLAGAAASAVFLAVVALSEDRRGDD